MAIHKILPNIGNRRSFLQKHAAPVLRSALLSLAVFVAAWHSPAQAVVLVSYGFDGLLATADAPYAATSADSNVTAGDFTPGSGLGSNGNWPSSNNGIDATAYGDPLPAFALKPTPSIPDQATAISSSAYWSFTVDPLSEYQLNLTSLTFDLKTVSASSGKINFMLSSSETGFTTPIGSVTNNFNSGTPFAPISYDLSGASFQNLTDPVEFRLYIWWSENLAGTSSGSAARFDNITLNGAVEPIPEPTAFVMLAAGLSLMALRRRRAISHC